MSLQKIEMRRRMRDWTAQVRRKVNGSRCEEARKLDRVQCVMSWGTGKLDRRAAYFPGCLGWWGRLTTHLETWTWVQVAGSVGGHNDSTVGIANYLGLE